ncbi:MAG: 16S rRNA (guanine(966)-N(2))-methyltransferase RsmD [Candidatus Firestonebacteria bacterium RIFOXYC2_FULL_39_67]|nr:MAG: 16S rRNA (guanine(966)-N(2))-methyltransferase RsmD [Candidatus Firestonebacteria bacterium RIFOXYD2_FULL_39_29]OGF51829.1 MAG: 16S rRNA (guanine(966)-N(2))-methyltransferase RsmD [Candidatus Firestonebacteria bacterium RifOxyC12_full_39_7]OGF53900.1 MAG: 16S rRNA (guanine(966)-N(2))-methyltransferase RsmD [Candidatus Firestonebacteria bacterium RIFOXYC2_FULL_39_67]
MRVIGGIARSRKVKMNNNLTIRPISDRVKQSLFEILKYDISDSVFLDLFAGSGSVGIEALSRGAREAVFVDSNEKCAGLIRENLRILGFISAEVINSDASRALDVLSKKGKKFLLVFLDPPYELGLIKNILKKLETSDILNENSVVIVKRHKKEILDTNFNLIKERFYGDTVLSFLKRKS